MRAKRKYAAFYRKRGTRKWIRRDGVAASKDYIVRLYQTWLLAGNSRAERQIRPIKRKKKTS